MDLDHSELTRGQRDRVCDDAPVVRMSVTEARALIDDVQDETLCSALDEAQGEVFGGNASETWVLLRIVRGLTPPSRPAAIPRQAYPQHSRTNAPCAPNC